MRSTRAERVRLRESCAARCNDGSPYSTSFAVAIAVAVTGMAGYFTLRLVALPQPGQRADRGRRRAVASRCARNIRNLGGLTEFTLRGRQLQRRRGPGRR